MKRKKELVIVLTSLLVIVLSVSVAYFTTKILGTEKDISVTSADLKVIFTNGGQDISISDIEPGWTSEKSTFSITNETNGIYTYSLVIKDLVNTVKTNGSFQYKITSTNNGYTMPDFMDLPKSETATDTILTAGVTIDKDITQEYTIEYRYIDRDDIDQSEDMNSKISGKIFIANGTKPTIYQKLLYDNTTRLTRNLKYTYTEDNTGTLFTTNETQDDSEVYYFAGNNVNNWVKFGYIATAGKCMYKEKEVLYFNGTSIVSVENKSQCLSSKVCKLGDEYGVGEVVNEELCANNDGEWLGENAHWEITDKTDFYWRIVRTNEDSSVRLLFAGTSTTLTGEGVGNSKYNTFTDYDTMYDGYMYGTSGSLENNRTNENSSTIKLYMDEVYKNILLSDFDKYISKDAIYCNDRTPSNNSTFNIKGFEYEAYDRIINKKPTLKCKSIEDQFTSETSNVGNKKLTYPAGLLTADEVYFAGGITNEYNINFNSWLTKTIDPKSKSMTFLMTPGAFEMLGGLGITGEDKSTISDYINNSSPVYPVISIKGCNTWKSGNGMEENPYEIEYTEGGC